MHSTDSFSHDAAFLYQFHRPPSLTFAPLSYMADFPASFPARSLVRAVRASLRVANESVDSLDLSQLLAIRDNLRETLGIIDGKIRDGERAAAAGRFSQEVRCN